MDNYRATTSQDLIFATSLIRSSRAVCKSQIRAVYHRSREVNPSIFPPKSGLKFLIFENFSKLSFSDAEREKNEQKDFELEEERGKRKEVEAQLSDFARYVDKIFKIVRLHLELEHRRNSCHCSE